MISVKVTSNAADVRGFLVEYSGSLSKRKSLNDALGRRLAKELQAHFRNRNSEPNKMAAPKTGFWNDVADATVLGEVTETGATVNIDDVRFRIQLYGGTIKPTNGRQFLTIPIIPEARGLRVSEYEAKTGRKLFRLPGRRVLMEQSESGTSSFTGQQTATVRSGGIYRKENIRARSQVRGVFALKKEVTIPRDPRALPPTAELLAALNDTAGQWLARQNRRKGNPES